MASSKKIVICGGGLVGALQACFLAKRGYDVHLYEFRQDIRKAAIVKGRSINLALSKRGRDALRHCDLEDLIIRNGIPMYARMIHDLDGTQRPIPYGTKDQYIMSVDRKRLNELLLTAAEAFSNVTLHFGQRIVRCDFEKNSVTFADEATNDEEEVTADLIIGCDGAYSTVRRQMMKAIRLDYKQEYIPHGYMELRIPPSKDGNFNLKKNYLHIWPRNEYMLIGLPNVEDNSFVMTLFMPFAYFEEIKTEDDAMEFFESNFPDAVDLIGRKELKDTFMSSTPLPLITVKCSPYNMDGKCVIMGDAAHAMVPFYGQGMNCGFEDCLVFEEMMEKYGNDFDKVLPAYAEYRKPDAQAMCDLAMYNYIEMRAKVNTKTFLIRKKVDNFLHWIMPRTWIPLYTMVSFTRTRYHECIEKRQWQDQVLGRLIGTAGAASVLGAAFLTAHWLRNQPRLAFTELLGELQISKAMKLWS